MNGRDKRGRFVTGNSYAVMGWQGLVSKRFNGDEVLAKEWLRQVGRFREPFGCASMFPPAARTPTMQWRYENLYRHPGKPEEFMICFQFKLEELSELAF